MLLMEDAQRKLKFLIAVSQIQPQFNSSIDVDELKAVINLDL